MRDLGMGRGLKAWGLGGKEGDEDTLCRTVYFVV